jgi:transketolase
MRKRCLDSVYDLAKKDSRVLFVGSDLGPDVLVDMKEKLPERFFMEGVSEQHLIGMAAGLAMEGFIPYVNTIATFITRRCYEQVALDLCLHDLPVRLIANGGGVVYAPLGPTHLAVEDIAIMRALPNMAVVAPCDAEEMQRFMNTTLDWPHPIYIRLGKGGDEVVSKPEKGFQIGKAIMMREPGKGLFISTGITAQIALAAAEKLANENNISVGVLHMHTVKPLDRDQLKLILPEVAAVVTAEEHTRIGGLGSALLEFCNDNLPRQLGKIGRVGLPDRFADQYGNQNTLLSHMGVSVETLCYAMRRQLSES